MSPQNAQRMEIQRHTVVRRTLWFAVLCLFTIRPSTAQVSPGRIRGGSPTDQTPSFHRRHDHADQLRHIGALRSAGPARTAN